MDPVRLLGSTVNGLGIIVILALASFVPQLVFDLETIIKYHT